MKLYVGEWLRDGLVNHPALPNSGCDRLQHPRDPKRDETRQENRWMDPTQNHE